MLTNPSLYYHTLRYLKPRQFYRRLWFRWIRPRVDISPRPALRPVFGEWLDTTRRRSNLLDADTFFFLNKSGRLSELGWDGPQREKLWRYNQHYFDDLNAINVPTRSAWHQRLVERWVAKNSPGQGVGWEPYPTSLRIVNWVKWHRAGNDLSQQCLQSMAVQIRWLTQRIEWHILGNHLFANAKALVYAGLFFSGPEAQKWLNMGLNIIRQELPEQVLSDGGNFERSPMYHAIFLEDILDLINLTGAYPDVVSNECVSKWRSYASKMMRWLEGMCHPDGEIAFFNDAAIGIAPSPEEILAYANRLEVPFDKTTSSSSNVALDFFEESGYVRLEAKDAVALLDVAPIGPDYLPGHAHADTLSFELSLFGMRALVNGGTSQYGSGPIRLQERGTAAHNTVEVNGENSSEIWSGFRVAKRAYPVGLHISKQGKSISVVCGHDGYQRLPGQPLHTREWQFTEGKLVVQDQIKGEFESAIARFHFHPDVKVSVIAEDRYLLALPDIYNQAHLKVLKGDATIEQSFHASEFGKRVESMCLAVRFETEHQIAIEISWRVNE